MVIFERNICQAVFSLPPRWHGASLRVGELLEQRHGTKASVKLASAREEQTTVYRRLYTPTNITARTEATLPLKKVLPALIVLPFGRTVCSLHQD